MLRPSPRIALNHEWSPSSRLALSISRGHPTSHPRLVASQSRVHMTLDERHVKMDREDIIYQANREGDRGCRRCARQSRFDSFHRSHASCLTNFTNGMTIPCMHGCMGLPQSKLREVRARGFLLGMHASGAPRYTVAGSRFQHSRESRVRVRTKMTCSSLPPLPGCSVPLHPANHSGERHRERWVV
ncbi:hypothetical protein IE81DRAFT_90551 [Ceraceosorus guamensis]|uniref:Uncharacterized protein n=1 Tax=Ceraceosorus guamensis TaxID=1522189 RepID=A0A316W2U3_9BASI|nr:hypothetical protein IE81DRAFT_90551 [Ceraceosorus guamensis]PWN43418.1 hypothetical protein IE81DRAFT_90551 [Ceraceosorus guamensis]